MVFQSSVLNWGVHLPLVYVHSSICETLLGVVVFQRSMLNWGVKLRVNLSCTLHLKIILLLATRCQLVGVNLKVPMTVNLKLTVAANLKMPLLMGTRCHCMNTSSENMKSFCVWPLDVSCQEGKLEGDSGSKLEGDPGRKLVGSKLDGALLLDTRCHYMNTSSENMKSFWVWPLDVTCWGITLKVTLAVNLKVTLAVAVT